MTALGLGGCCVAHSLYSVMYCLLVVERLLLSPQNKMHYCIVFDVCFASFLGMSELEFKSYFCQFVPLLFRIETTADCSNWIVSCL